jgi:aminoglycoside phosphotransferase (APT) family kinase protein
MRRPEIEALCAEIVPGKGGVQVERMSEGLVHESYRVARDGHEYSLRLSIADAGEIALDRAWEAALLKSASDAQLAPPVRYDDAIRGILLSDWVPGRTWDHAEVESDAGIAGIAGLLRRVHALPIPVPAHAMSPPDWVRHYDSSSVFPGPRLRAMAASHLKEWAALPAAAGVICHGDLHALNLLQTGDSLRLLDWEYAHVSEPFWDLAGWCANGDLNDSACGRLLDEYLQRPSTPVQRRRLGLLRWLYDYICLQWSLLYLRRGRSGPSIPARAALLDARLSLPAN